MKLETLRQSMLSTSEYHWSIAASAQFGVVDCSELNVIARLEFIAENTKETYAKLVFEWGQANFLQFVQEFVDVLLSLLLVQTFLSLQLTI